MEEEIIIGRRDFNPARKGFIPIVAIYMNDKDEAILVESDLAKGQFTKESIIELLSAIVENNK